MLMHRGISARAMGNVEYASAVITALEWGPKRPRID